MCQILRVQLSSDPLTTILGIFNDAVGIDSAKPCFISYCIIFAKKLILTRWKERDTTPLKLWLMMMLQMHYTWIEHNILLVTDSPPSVEFGYPALHFCSCNQQVVFRLLIKTD